MSQHDDDQAEDAALARYQARYFQGSEADDDEPNALAPPDPVPADETDEQRQVRERQDQMLRQVLDRVFPNRTNQT